MLNNIIFIKILALFYVNYISFANKRNILLTILFICAYIGVVSGRIFLEKKHKNIFLGLDIAVSLFMAIILEPSAIILLNVCVMEICFFIIKKEVTAFALPLILTLFTFNIRDIVTVGILTLLIFIIIRNMNRNKIKFCIMVNTVEKQRRHIAIIEERLRKEKRVREQFLYTTKLEEINEVTDDLYKEIGKTFSNSILKLNAVKAMITKDLAGSKEILRKSLDELKEGKENIKNIVRRIKPSQGELGINRLKMSLENNVKNTGIGFKVEFNGDIDRIPIEYWKFLKKAVDELAKNAIRYSKGDFIKVDLMILDESFVLKFKDNGVGADNLIKGTGLINLDKDLSKIEGNIMFEKNEGLLVRIYVPLTN